jgi:pyridoxal phosphate enzyme (YggS family)
MSVSERLEQLNARIAAACARAGRPRESVRLLAVSKLQSLAKIREAYDCGQKYFGENYVQEALGKLEQLASLPAEWHFIGRIQSNKVKQIAGRFALIHSVDRASILEALAKTGRPQDVLLQFNVAGEASKGGADERALEELLAAARGTVRVRGLMVMPPFTERPEEVRPCFRRAREVAARLGLSELSMGTTQDFEVAIEEGATWIRIGTDVFGPREDV